jgi:hypothetical protein
MSAAAAPWAAASTFPSTVDVALKDVSIYFKSAAQGEGDEGGDAHVGGVVLREADDRRHERALEEAVLPLRVDSKSGSFLAFNVHPHQLPNAARRLQPHPPLLGENMPP